MKYLIQQVATVVKDDSSATNFTAVDTKNDLQSAVIKWHQVSAALWNEPTVQDATICILDENLDKVNGYSEHIHHDVEPTTEE